MSALGTKLRRDLWRSRGQVVAVAVVVACAVATSAGAVATARALERSRDLYYARAAMPDVFAEAVRAPEAVAGRLRALPGVAEVETRVAGDGRVTWPGGSARVRLVSVAGGGGRLGRLEVRSGRLPGPGEAVASEGFAVAARLAPGDPLDLVVNGRLQRIRLAGVALSPEYVYTVPPGGLMPDDRRFGVLWTPRHDLEAALDFQGAFDSVALRLAPGAGPAGVLEGVDAALRPFGGQGAVPLALQLSNAFLSDEIRQQRATATVLPGIFLGVAAFLVSVALSRLVVSQRMQLGMLKAIGYGDAAIGLHFAGYAAAIALLGAAVGVGVGHLFGLAMSRMYADYYRFPVLDYRADPQAMITAAGLALAAALLGAAGAVRRAVRLAPAEAMRPPAPGRFRATPLERLAGGLLPLTGRMALRGLARRPVHAALGSLGIASAVAVLVTGGYMWDAIDAMVRVTFEVALRADAVVAFSRPAPPAALLELRRLPGVRAAEPLAERAAVLRHGARQRRVALAAVEPGTGLMRLVGQDGREVAVPPDGVVISSRLADRLEAPPGTALEVELLEGHRATGRLVVAATVDDVLGLNATVSGATLRHLARTGGELQGARLAVDAGARGGLERALDARPGVAGVAWRRDTVESFRDTIGATMLGFVGVLLGFAVAIAGGVVYSAVRTAFAERSRELATLRVIGFTPGEAWRILTGEVALQLLAALPLGVLLGLGLAHLTSRSFETDLFRIPVAIGRTTWLLSLGAVALATLLTTLVARRWIRRLELAAALRSGD